MWILEGNLIYPSLVISKDAVWILIILLTSTQFQPHDGKNPRLASFQEAHVMRRQMVCEGLSKRLQGGKWICFSSKSCSTLACSPIKINMTNDVHAKLVKLAFVVKLAFSFIFIDDAVGYGCLMGQERLIYGLIIDIDYLWLSWLRSHATALLRLVCKTLVPSLLKFWSFNIQYLRLEKLNSREDTD